MIYPRSFLNLLLLGFALAMLPLLFAFGNAALYVDRLAEQSRSTVAQAVEATRASRMLVEQLNLMERSARQYAVLNDGQLLDNFHRAHARFTANLQILGRLPLSQQQLAALAAIGGQETALYKEISDIGAQNQALLAAATESATLPASATGTEFAPANLALRSVLPGTGLTPSGEVEPIRLSDSSLAQFRSLSTQAQDILAENNRLIDRESASLAENAERTQKMLFWQTLTLVPVAFLVALLITYLVARPIRHMDAAIKHLGEGHYEDPISIEGPGDMRVLGERLDWLRAQLRLVEEEKQRFLRHISHELKTPLTAIRQGSELLSDEVGGALGAQQKEIVQILRDNSLRLQEMIENLLHYTAAQFKRPPLNLSTVSLADCMQHILGSYALMLSSKHIDVQSELQPIYLSCDQEKIHTVIDNLISNAIKYTPQHGAINLRIAREKEYAVMEVYDNGPGVMASDKARLFDPFYRGSAVYDSLVSGSGLGLSIAKEYVDAHGGEISLIPSKSGAHFRVRLPLVAAPFLPMANTANTNQDIPA